ncbi:MAG TPA: peptide chain release factor N(5)-glutamine methyltransferase [Anaerolineaceae bacterium]
MKSNLKQWLGTSTQLLAAVSDSPALECQVLVSHVLKRSRAWIIAHPEYVLHPEQEILLNNYVHQRTDGVALPYILGHWEFYGMDFIVSPAVLIPRPETEMIIDETLDWFLEKKSMLLTVPFQVADIGTGSGCIAITLAKYLPDIKILAIDRSFQALKIARINAIRHHVQHQVHFTAGDLFTSLSDKFSIICANLPYIPSANLDTLAVSRSEPRLALDGGPDGLTLIRSMLCAVPPYFPSPGLILIETQFDQAETVADLAKRIFSQAEVRVLTDLAGNPRLVRIERRE